MERKAWDFYKSFYWFARNFVSSKWITSCPSSLARNQVNKDIKFVMSLHGMFGHQKTTFGWCMLRFWKPLISQLYYSLHSVLIYPSVEFFDCSHMVVSCWWVSSLLGSFSCCFRAMDFYRIILHFKEHPGKERLFSGRLGGGFRVKQKIDVGFVRMNYQCIINIKYGLVYTECQATGMYSLVLWPRNNIFGNSAYIIQLKSINT